MKRSLGLIGFGAWIFLSSCGQDPAFSDQNQGILPANSPSGGGTGQGDATASGGQPVFIPGSDTPVEGGPSVPVIPGSGTSQGGGTNTAGGGAGTGGGVTNPTSPSTPSYVFPSNPSDPNSPTFSVPGATSSEVAQISACLRKWGSVPFTDAIGVRRIAAAVTVGGYGVAINDVTQTTGPSLVLVDAGVNVMSSPVYNMLNNNGYYCMKVNVNVKTALTVNLGCNARLADNSVQVNVGGYTGGTTSVVGVNVNSNVVVKPMTPSGGACY